MTVSYFWSLLGVLAAIASVLLLRQSWQLRRQGRANGFLRWGAWAAAGISGAFWITASTPDWGVAVSLCIFMLAGVAAVAWIAALEPRRKELEAGKDRTVADTDPANLDWGIILRRVGIFLIAGPLAGAASLLLTLWVYGMTFDSNGDQTASQLFLTLFGFPFFWAILALIATYDMPLFKRSGLVFLSAILGLIGTYSIL